MRTHGTNPWLVLVLICFAQFMVVLDATVVNVALPSIQADLGLSEANLQWIVNAYTLVFGGFLLLGGRAGDILGRKRLFLFGLVVFTVASLLDGLADLGGDADRLPRAAGPRRRVHLAGRARDHHDHVRRGHRAREGARRLGCDRDRRQRVRPHRRRRADRAALVAVDLLHQRADRHRRVRPLAAADPESKDETAHHGFDVAGAVTATGGLMMLVYAIVQAHEQGWISRATLGLFAVSVGLLVAFVLIEQRAKEPLVRLNIFRVRSLTAANVVMLLVASGIFAMFFFNSLYIQQVLGFGPLKAGLAFLPFTAGIMVSAGLASQFSPIVGVRSVAIVGMVISALGMLLLTRVPADGLVPGRHAPGADPDVARHGRGVRPAHADRDHRPQERGPGARVGPLQHVAADRRCARARDPLHDRREPRRGVDRNAMPSTLVDGFHWAFAGAAVFVLAGLVLLLVLLRKEDVAQISAETAPVPIG